MRYTEPKERSAELLRAALAKMGQHDAAFNPVTFAVWYEVVAGGNNRLERALQERLKSEPRLSDESMLRLHQEHVSEIDDTEMTRLSVDFQRVMDNMSDSATRTGQRAGEFGQQLDGLSNALQHENSSLLKPALNETLAGIADMKSAAEALAQQVAAGQLEIDRLRDDLTRARQEALTDPLTGIQNRSGFDRQLGQLLAQAPRDGTAHCLVMFDIDHFKKVNDTHGHVVGDRVIAAVGEVLRKSIGEGGGGASRYGGEEFAVLMPHSSTATASQLAEAVRQRVKAMKLRNRTTQEVMLTVTISAGVAAMRNGDDAGSSIARADAALYKSKQSGRDRVTLG